MAECCSLDVAPKHREVYDRSILGKADTVTPEDSDAGRLNLPVVRSIGLRQFTLYMNEPELEVNVTDGVCCFAGANGIGKSTLLAAINFAITGIVAEPGRKFESPDEFLHDCAPFTRSYFDGRISESDWAVAEVEVEMNVGEWRYTLARGFADPSELRKLEIVASDGAVLAETGNLSGFELESQYRDLLPRHMGLDSFAQAVFIQHYILSFDERRHLLLWEQRSLEECLHIVFGRSAQEAAEASELRRTIERQDSIARNRNFHARNLQRDIQELEDLLEEEKPENGDGGEITAEEIEERVAKTEVRADELASQIEAREDELRDAQQALAEAVSNHEVALGEHRELVERIVGANDDALLADVLGEAQESGRCLVCGELREGIATHLDTQIAGGGCPLCGGALSSHTPDASASEGLLEELIQCESRIEAAAQITSDTEQRIARIQSQLAEMVEERQSLFEQLENLERLRDPRNSAGDDSANPVLFRIVVLRETREKLLRQKADAYEKRNAARKALHKIQGQTERRYQSAAEQFLPVFTGLAESFLGLDLNVHLEVKKPDRLLLFTEMRGSARRRAYQLSESQRFFLDIAFRMSLVQFGEGTSGRSTLLIDTPEGALDIAYEARAGDMFAKYVSLGNNLLITANINTSQLLINLAKACGSEGMQVHRMTGWGELSDVQIEEEGRFQDAIDGIERALVSE